MITTTATATATRFVVLTAAAAMPNSCWGVYRRVGVLEVAADADESRLTIDERRKGVVRVVTTWEKLNVGTTARCAYQRALAEAKALAASLTAAHAA
jgi:hypothetical protein